MSTNSNGNGMDADLKRQILESRLAGIARSFPESIPWFVHLKEAHAAYAAALGGDDRAEAAKARNKVSSRAHELAGSCRLNAGMPRGYSAANAMRPFSDEALDAVRQALDAVAPVAHEMMASAKALLNVLKPDEALLLREPDEAELAALFAKQRVFVGLKLSFAEALSGYMNSAGGIHAYVGLHLDDAKILQGRAYEHRPEEQIGAPRSVVSICAMQAEMPGGVNLVLAAMADDGTLWACGICNGELGWTRMPDLPAAGSYEDRGVVPAPAVAPLHPAASA